MTWTDIESPGVYRACVPRPKDGIEMTEVVTGGLVEHSNRMTITHCLHSCIALVSKMGHVGTLGGSRPTRYNFQRLHSSEHVHIAENNGFTW